MGISGAVACDCRIGVGGGRGGHVAGPGVGKSVFIWSCKEVDVLYSAEIGIDI